MDPLPKPERKPTLALNPDSGGNLDPSPNSTGTRNPNSIDIGA